MIDLDQARTRAKELLRDLRTTYPDAKLADAQHRTAQDLGHRTWADLARDAERFRRTTPHDVVWSRVRRVSVVCFVEGSARDEDAVVVLYEQDGRWTLPSGARGRGEDVWDESVLLVPMRTMGFRRQSTHFLALDHDRRHIVFWVDGGRYAGTRMPHRADVEWWSGTAAEAAELLHRQGDGALARLVEQADDDRRTMTDDRHAADLHRTLVGAYLGAVTPQGGSGFGGSDQEWRDARGVLADALDARRDVVRLLDLCCANGHLAVSLTGWGAERGIRVEPYGVDVAPELVERARADHPAIAERFAVGDALIWRDPRGLRFDLVHMLYDVVPADLWPALTQHLLEEVVAPGGRLLVSHYGQRAPEAIVAGLGLRIAGRTAVPHRNGRPHGFASVWIDA